MPTKFWSDESEDTRSIEEIMANSSPIPDESGNIPVTSINRHVGMRVKPGKDWGVNVGSRIDVYKPEFKTGTIKQLAAGPGYEDFTLVTWDDPRKDNWYRTGNRTSDHVPGFDLYVLED